ncbi:MAG: hypothetical protein IKJ42_10865 [Bacteroidaceae bacterium]|nr:hypothetical protein [Bacteroidaceae bacterium]
MIIKINDGLSMIQVGDFFICYGEHSMKVIADKGAMSVSPVADNSVLIRSLIKKEGNDEGNSNA